MWTTRPVPRLHVAVLLAAAAIPGAPAAGVAGQSPVVVVTVVEEGGGPPVPGVWLTLLPAPGDPGTPPTPGAPPDTAHAEMPAPGRVTSPTVVARGISDADGRARLRPPEPGLFVLRAERIGFRTVDSEPIRLDPDRVHELSLELPMQAITLEAIDVEGDARCVLRPEEGVRTAALWDEARKALDLLEFTEAERIYRYLVVRRERRLDPRDLGLRDEAWSADWHEGAVPFESQPAEDLIGRGFVQPADDGLYYYAPDAAVLLSDPFLDAHCFRALPPSPDEPELVGLGFEPLPDHPAPALEGALWLDAATAELRFAEFRYRGAPGPDDDRVGGRVEFDRLPSGAWIVRRWRIRMPALRVTSGRAGTLRYRARTEIEEFIEVGAEVVDLLPRHGEG